MHDKHTFYKDSSKSRLLVYKKSYFELKLPLLYYAKFDVSVAQPLKR